MYSLIYVGGDRVGRCGGYRLPTAPSHNIDDRANLSRVGTTLSRAIDMPRHNKLWIKAPGLVTAAAAVAGLAACATMMTTPPELISGSETQVVILADLNTSPRPLATSHCAQYGKRAMLSDTVPAAGNLLRGWAVGTKVFIYTFDCR